MPFDIIVSGFGNQLLHFDLYSQEVNQSGNSASFAPFSHDATGQPCGVGLGCGPDFPPVNEAPEPGSVFLLGLGLLGIAVASRRPRPAIVQEV